MYAVVEIGGHQYRVSEGDVLFVDKQKDDIDQKVTFDRVLLVNNGNDNVSVGKPAIEGATVEATVLDHVKSDKVIVFKKKRRKGYQVKRGHRQPMSQIEINSISADGSTSSASESSKESQASSGQDSVSTDMTAKEAISHIKETPLDQLQGFVPEDEERVTVLDAWENKQEG